MVSVRLLEHLVIRRHGVGADLLRYMGCGKFLKPLLRRGIMCTSAFGLCRYTTVGSTHHRLCNVSAICSALVNVYGDCLGSESFDAKSQSHTPM